MAVPAAAIARLQISIILIDDMLDTDPRGEYHRIGKPITANLAAAFQAAGLEAITRSDVSPDTKLAALKSLNRMMSTTALGQYLDVQNPEKEDGYLTLVHTKSSPFFGAALHVGTLLGGASSDVAEQIKELGHIYSKMIQIHNDLNETMKKLSPPATGIKNLPALIGGFLNCAFTSFFPHHHIRRYLC